jgi:protein-tyrosine phosphatase
LKCIAEHRKQVDRAHLVSEYKKGVTALSLLKYDTRILFVCRENICRSPLAEGLLRHYLRHSGVAGRHKVSAAGTRTSQPGARPDPRAQRLASAAGVEIRRIKARRVKESDLTDSDLVFAMDHTNLAELRKACPQEHLHKLHLFLAQCPDLGLEDVPDPYYGSYQGFAEVYELIDRALQCLLSEGGMLQRFYGAYFLN